MPVETVEPWPLWQRVLFRFFFIYLVMYAAPWNWLGVVPGVAALLTPIRAMVNATVQWANRTIFHVRPELVLPNGSGDTSWAWTQLWLMLSVAVLGMLVWSVVDRQRSAYPRLLYWLRTVVRYTLATFALSYGIIKLFLLQMTFPNESALATPLGDLLPMRLSWHFIGYSAPYQFFSGAAETAAGLLLLYRPTVTLGVLAAAGAFLNVVMINIGYDVPVKLFSSHLLVMSLFLVALDAPRLLAFFVHNQGAPRTLAWEPPFTAPWQRYARWAAKGAFIIVALVMPLNRGWTGYKAQRIVAPATPFVAGLYEVRTFVRGRDTVRHTASDTIRWRDVAIDGAGRGSVGSTDTLFWQRYRRGHFRFSADTANKRITFWRSSWRFDSTFLFSARYAAPDTSTMRMWTEFRGESLYVEMVRQPRHYQLTERQFHWLSEYNR